MVTSHATQALINSVRVSTSLLLASCLRCLGCSPELLAAAKQPEPQDYATAQAPVPLHAFMLQMQLLGLCSFWLFIEVTKAPQHFLYWICFVFISPTILNILSSIHCFNLQKVFC